MRTDTAREPLWQEFMILHKIYHAFHTPAPTRTKYHLCTIDSSVPLFSDKNYVATPFHFCLFIKILGNGFFQLSFWKRGGGCNMSIKMFSLHFADISRNRASTLRIVVTCWWNIAKTDVGNALKQKWFMSKHLKISRSFYVSVDIKTK